MTTKHEHPFQDLEEQTSKTMALEPVAVDAGGAAAAAATVAAAAITDDEGLSEETTAEMEPVGQPEDASASEPAEAWSTSEPADTSEDAGASEPADEAGAPSDDAAAAKPDVSNGAFTVDPSVLTDDRRNPDLLIFEKTWGHRMLAGISVVMLVIAAVLIIYCASQLSSVASRFSGIADYLVTVGYVLYGTGLVAGVLVVPPAIVGLVISMRPRRAMIAVVLAVIALVMDMAFVGFAFASGSSAALTIVLYGLLFALVPALYLVASIKIVSSNAENRGRVSAAYGDYSGYGSRFDGDHDSGYSYTDGHGESQPKPRPEPQFEPRSKQRSKHSKGAHSRD